MKTGKTTIDSASLVSRAQADEQAFTQLYRLHYDAVFKYCVHRLYNRDKAKDATSVVFLKVVEKLHTFKGPEPKFSCWLLRIASNVVNDLIRREQRKQRALEKYAQPDITSDPEIFDEADHLKEAIRSLKPKYQTIITLRFFENMKSKQIAEILGAETARLEPKCTGRLNS